MLIRVALVSITYLASSLAVASEPLPNVPIPPRSKSPIDSYRSKSRSALSKLDGLVARTKPGDKAIRKQWVDICIDVRQQLRKLAKEKMITQGLWPWYKAESAAWVGIQTTGATMLNHHYRMNSTVASIERDIKTSEAFFRDWRGRLNKLNEYAAKGNDAIAKINGSRDDFKDAIDAAGKLGGFLGEVDTHSRVVARLLVRFKKRKIKFIKDRDLKGRYRDRLNALKSKKIDPDGSGTFYQHETRWEDAMYRTYQRYVAAVDEWKRIHQWINGKNGMALIKKGAARLQELLENEVLDMALPGMRVGDAEKLGELCLKARRIYRKVVQKIKGEEFARLEDALLTIDEEERTAKAEYQDKLRKLEREAKDKCFAVEDRTKKAIQELEAKRDRALRKLGKAGTNEKKEQDATREVDAWERQIENAKRGERKDKVYIMGGWLEAREEAAYEILKAKLDGIAKRRKLNERARSRVRR